MLWELASGWIKFCEVLSHIVRSGMYAMHVLLCFILTIDVYMGYMVSSFCLSVCPFVCSFLLYVHFYCSFLLFVCSYLLFLCSFLVEHYVKVLCQSSSNAP